MLASNKLFSTGSCSNLTKIFSGNYNQKELMYKRHVADKHAFRQEFKNNLVIQGVHKVGVHFNNFI